MDLSREQNLVLRQKRIIFRRNIKSIDFRGGYDKIKKYKEKDN